jgi:hypothetical protein
VTTVLVPAVLGLCVSLLSACAGEGGDTTGAPEAPDVATGGTESSPAAAEALTEADDGGTVALALGEERPLRLDSAWSWEPVAGSPAIALTRVDHLVDPGYAEWLVGGVQPGAATLTARGEPNCGDPVDCPPRTLALTVEVSG